ncbi:MAG: response regulator transcription factor [Crocinitomicaceae bacterium]|nr:response regulator transcription factor [Crocinitomicaceae bacterium]
MIEKTPQKPIRIVVAEDHVLLRETIRTLLNKEVNFQVVFEVGNGAELIEGLRKKEVDIVLLDLEMPVLNGSETLKIISKSHPRVKTLVLSMYNDQTRVKKCFQLGAKGYLSKACQYNELVTALNALDEGRIYLNNSSANRAYRQFRSGPIEQKLNDIDDPLTEREKQILNLICREKTSQEIAIELNLSRRTIENHTLNIRKKTGANNSIGLMTYALKRNLFSL